MPWVYIFYECIYGEVSFETFRHLFLAGSFIIHVKNLVEVLKKLSNFIWKGDIIELFQQRQRAIKYEADCCPFKNNTCIYNYIYCLPAIYLFIPFLLFFSRDFYEFHGGTIRARVRRTKIAGNFRQFRIIHGAWSDVFWMRGGTRINNIKVGKERRATYGSCTDRKAR